MIDDRHKQNAISVGGEQWGLLTDAASDTEFHALLTGTEKNVISNWQINPSSIGGHKDHFAGILSKYVSWRIYKDSDIKKLKKNFDSISQQIDKGREKLNAIEAAATYIGGATILVKYAESFKTSAETHGTNAQIQQHHYFISLLALATIGAAIFFVSFAEFRVVQNVLADDIKGLPFNTAIFALKAALLIFVYQVTQHFRKNYGAEMHLQEVYLHRSNVLQSLHAVYNSIKDENERDKILSAGALIAYERGETGYITTKEGAGNTDGMLESVIGKALNR